MKTVVPLSAWEPDRAPFGSPAEVTVRNCYAAVDGYQEAPSLEPFSTSAAARCYGAFSARSNDNTQYIFVGTLTTLQQATGTSWTSATNTIKDYELSSGVQWEFAQFGNRVVATAMFDGSEATASATTFPQSYVMGTSSAFENLLQANDGAGEPMFRASHVATVRDFLMFGDILYDGTRFANRIWWTALNNPTTITPSSTTLADYTDLPDTGWVRRIYGGETALIITDKGIWRATFVGAPVVFQLDLILPSLATNLPYAGVQHEGIVYHYTSEGFCAIGRDGSVRRIGKERVDRYFRDQLPSGREYQVSCAVDPRTGRVFWAYPTGSATAYNDRILVYDIALDRWTEILEDTELVFQAGTAGAGGPDDATGYWGANLINTTGWTVGANWVEAPDETFTHAAGSTAAISHSFAPTIGKYYNVTFTVAGRTAGSITVAFGGSTTATYTGTSFSSNILASAATGLVITPTTDFDGVVSATIVKLSPDSLEVSPDSEIFQGGKQPQLAAVDAAHRVGVFDGAAMTAFIETKEAALGESRRALVRGVRPLCEGGTLAIAIGGRNRLEDAVTWDTSATTNASGVSIQRNDSRYHRARIGTTGNFRRIQGLEVDFSVTGER